MKKVLKRTGIVLVCVILLLVIVIVTLFFNELRSLLSLKQIDDYGMFQMTYYGDYGFDEFLTTGASNDEDIESFVAKRLTKGLPIDFDVTGGGCTVFVTRNEAGEPIMGRNFDFTYSPSLQVITRPGNGYASVSTVNLSFLGYSENNLPKARSISEFLILAAPFLPFDGMNEKGLTIALLAVPIADGGFDKNKITLNTTTAMRLVLDKAATADEAVELLRGYNIYFSGGVDCHFLIGDAGGKSVLVEYYDGSLQTVTTDAGYQIASNFIAFNDVNIGEGFDEFERYNTVKEAIESNSGSLSREQAISLLTDVGVYSEDEDKSEWSVVYNMSSLEGTVFAGRNALNLTEFKLTP